MVHLVITVYLLCYSTLVSTLLNSLLVLCVGVHDSLVLGGLGVGVPVARPVAAVATVPVEVAGVAAAVLPVPPGVKDVNKLSR